ncbi:hypothetical protein HZH66_002372 [Vespula vulgaris]|uniref:Uncharacterized protein n=1 Tax=Vespula vulgaris TaxID=7454 RepID=A0A834NF63_VESVU|nr:hypothetical protein HZH66_002372 [Vespula vulgaris]
MEGLVRSLTEEEEAEEEEEEEEEERGTGSPIKRQASQTRTGPHASNTVSIEWKFVIKSRGTAPTGNLEEFIKLGRMRCVGPRRILGE